MNYYTKKGEGKTINVIKIKKQLTTYKKLSTEFYDLELAQRENREQVLSFYMDYARKAQGSILEPMCGTGRFIIPMLEAGLAVEGFDASSHMLDELRRKYALVSNEAPPVCEQFVEDFSSEKRYDLIFVPFGSWGLITNSESSKECLRIMHRHLEKNGKLLLEIETVASVSEPCGVSRYAFHTRKDVSRLSLTMVPSYDPATQMFTSIGRYESLVGATILQTETERFEQYLYRFEEMDERLKDVGFSKIQKYMDYSKTVATNPNDSILIYECIR
jgi:ubiquinone/menaquinone biosynthesis C-methylase UbiE